MALPVPIEKVHPNTDVVGFLRISRGVSTAGCALTTAPVP